jgi:hypothetical protein
MFYLALLFLLIVDIDTASSQSRFTFSAGTGLFFRETFTGESGNSSIALRYALTKRWSVFMQHDINTYSDFPKAFSGNYESPEHRERGTTEAFDAYIKSLSVFEALTINLSDGQYLASSLGIGFDLLQHRKFNLTARAAATRFVTRELIGRINVTESMNDRPVAYNVYFEPYHLRSFGALFGLQTVYNVSPRIGLLSEFTYSFIPGKDYPAIQPEYLVFMNARIGVAFRI